MWFGLPGQLVQLPNPKLGVSGAPTVPTSVTTLLSGAQVVQRAQRGSRTWTLPFRLLTEAQAGLLTGFYVGHYGRGPWVFLSGLDRNLLSPNQSSGTDALATTEGFTASHGTLASSAAQYYQGSRSLLWTLPSSTPGTPPFVSLTWSGSDYGIPVLPNTNYAASARIAGDSASFEVRLDLRWYTAAGSLISTSRWAPTALSGSLSDHSHVAISGLSPATAAFVKVAPVAETMVTNGHLSIDAMQLQMAPVSSDWVPGVGVPRVSITGMSHEYGSAGFHDLGGVTLAEVGT